MTALHDWDGIICLFCLNTPLIDPSYHLSHDSLGLERFVDRIDCLG